MKSSLLHKHTYLIKSTRILINIYIYIYYNYIILILYIIYYIIFSLSRSLSLIHQLSEHSKCAARFRGQKFCSSRLWCDMAAVEIHWNNSRIQDNTNAYKFNEATMNIIPHPFPNSKSQYIALQSSHSAASSSVSKSAGPPEPHDGLWHFRMLDEHY